jgi:hypothetical protein
MQTYDVIQQNKTISKTSRVLQKHLTAVSSGTMVVWPLLVKVDKQTSTQKRVVLLPMSM